MANSDKISPFFFDSEKLMDLARNKQKDYQKAEPFPHASFDDFFPEWVLDQVLEEYPRPGSIPWKKWEAATEKKLSSRDETQFGPFTRHLLSQFNSSTFIAFLEELTGIEGIIPDPYFLGGGLHQIETGGYLKVHTDFNWHTQLKLERRLNLLVYLNKDWKEEYGGHLELWDKNMTECKQRILPVFNRLALFSTSRFSYHGHPQPLTCPEDRTRKSLALYYYTAGRPDKENFGQHSTLYQQRPGEKWSHLRNVLIKCVPPILYDLLASLEQKMKKR